MKDAKEKNIVAYKAIKEICQRLGLRKENTSMMTLLLPPGMFLHEHDFMTFVEDFLSGRGYKYIIFIEPVIGCNDLYKKAGFNEYRDDLPWYHAHVLIEDDVIDREKLRRDWYKLVNRTSKKLFLCTPLKNSLSTAVNYVVKFLEKKRDGRMIFRGSEIIDKDNGITRVEDYGTPVLAQIEATNKAHPIFDFRKRLIDSLLFVRNHYMSFIYWFTQSLEKIRKLE